MFTVNEHCYATGGLEAQHSMYENLQGVFALVSIRELGALQAGWSAVRKTEPLIFFCV